MEDIRNPADIITFVDAFYEKVKRDPQIGPVFFAAIAGDWQPHLERMYAFWGSVLFSMPGYSGNPFAKHATMAIGEQHFQQWLHLFDQTIDENFAGTMAEEAKKRAKLIADIFVSRLFNGKGGLPITR